MRYFNQLAHTSLFRTSRAAAIRLPIPTRRITTRIVRTRNQPIRIPASTRFPKHIQRPVHSLPSPAAAVNPQQFHRNPRSGRLRSSRSPAQQFRAITMGIALIHRVRRLSVAQYIRWHSPFKRTQPKQRQFKTPQTPFCHHCHRSVKRLQTQRTQSRLISTPTHISPSAMPYNPVSAPLNSGFSTFSPLFTNMSYSQPFDLGM